MLEGNFRDISLASLLQLLCLERNKSYRIRLSTEHQKGYILVRKGWVIAAQFGLLEGEDAICEFLSWEDGNFWAQHVIAQTDVETNLKEPFQPNPGFIEDCAILTEHHIGLNTEITGSATFGSPGWKELIREHPLDRECLSVLAWVRDGRKMHQALREFGFDIVRATQILALLIRTQSIQTLRPGFLDPGQQVLRRKISTTGGQDIAAAKLAQEAAKALEAGEELSQEAFVSRSYKEMQSENKPAAPLTPAVPPTQSTSRAAPLPAASLSAPQNAALSKSGQTPVPTNSGSRLSDSRLSDNSSQDVQSITSDIPIREITQRNSMDARLRAKRNSSLPSGADLPVYDEAVGAQSHARLQAEQAKLPINGASSNHTSASSDDKRKPDLSSVLQRNRERVIPIIDYEHGALNSTPTSGANLETHNESLSAPPSDPATAPASASAPTAAPTAAPTSGSTTVVEDELTDRPWQDAALPTAKPVSGLSPNDTKQPDASRRDFAGNGASALEKAREMGRDFLSRSPYSDACAETGEIRGIVSPLDIPRDRRRDKSDLRSDWASQSLLQPLQPNPDALLSFEPGSESKKIAAPNMLPPPESTPTPSESDQPKSFPSLPADDPRVLVRTQSMPVVEMDIERLLQATARATQFGKLALGNPSLDPHRRQTVIDAENGLTLAGALQDPGRSPAAVLASYRYCLDRGYIEAQDTVIPLTADLLLGRIELDQYLLQRRRITGDELRDLMRIARDEGIKLSHLLVTSGFLTQSDLEILKREQRRFAFR